MLVMSYFKAEVKKYEKKYTKKTKAGTKKEARTFQYSIPLQKDNPFQEHKNVFILTINQMNELLNAKTLHESSESIANSDYQNVKLNLEEFQAKYKALQSEYDKLNSDMADIKSEYDLMQIQLDEQKSKVQKLTKENKEQLESITRKQSKIDRLNEENKKALKDLNDVQNELNKYSEFKGMIESKGRIIRWIAGLNRPLKAIEGR